MSEAQPLTIEYSLTRPEILRSFVRSAVESPKSLATILAYAVGIATLGLLLYVTSSHSIAMTDVVRASAWGVGFLCFIPLWVFVRSKTARRILTISRDGISTEIGRLKAQIPWDKVRTVTDTSHFVLIARTNGNAFFVPHRAFSTPDQRGTFLKSISGWMDERSARP
jgi:YcxB-like protein